MNERDINWRIGNINLCAMFGIAAGMNFEGSVSSDPQSDEWIVHGGTSHYFQRFQWRIILEICQTVMLLQMTDLEIKTGAK